jgi:hypothetical protein
MCMMYGYTYTLWALPQYYMYYLSIYIAHMCAHTNYITGSDNTSQISNDHGGGGDDRCKEYSVVYVLAK